MEGYGEIYCVKSPSGKVYIGQAHCFLANGTKYGTEKRWLGHISDSKRKGGGNCRRLNYAIRKYGAENLTVVQILTTPIHLLDFYEHHFIDVFQSDHSDYGYNLRKGGRTGKLSQETRNIMSINRKIKPCFNQPHSETTKQKISESLINNVERTGHTGQILPKYIKYVDWKDRKGYAIVSHPKCKLKYFVSKRIDLDVLYSRCLIHLETL